MSNLVHFYFSRMMTSMLMPKG